MLLARDSALRSSRVSKQGKMNDITGLGGLTSLCGWSYGKQGRLAAERKRIDAVQTRLLLYRSPPGTSYGGVPASIRHPFDLCSTWRRETGCLSGCCFQSDLFSFRRWTTAVPATLSRNIGRRRTCGMSTHRSTTTE